MQDIDTVFRPEIIIWLVPLTFVDVVLRGMALWKSAQKNQKPWFIALLLVNSLGILPLIYLWINRSTKNK